MLKSNPTVSRRTVLSGIGAAAASMPLARVARAQARKLDHVNIVNASGNLTATLEQLMVQQGFREKFGIDAKPTFVSDGNKIMGSLIGGEMDICPLSGFAQVFPAVEKGARIKIVNGSVVLGQQTVFTARPDIKSVADLKGKTIGVGSVGAQLHQAMVALLTKKGVDINSVTFANIGSSADVFRAVSAKVVDAGPGQIDNIPQAAKFGVHTIEGGDMWTSIPEYPFQGGFAPDRTIADKRELLVRTLAAYASLFRFLTGPDSLDAWREARRKALSHSDAAFEEGSDFQWHFIQKAQPFAKDLILSPERIDVIQSLNVQFHIQSKKLPYESVVDMSLARDAAKLLG
jgi:ABC-type nitrate/sulfonate/bicarbonate transport system substrate-binding protein